MITSRWLPALVLMCLSDAVHAQKACEPSGGLQFVCGPKSAEDLVLVPGTPWILSSGMAEGASFFQIDSRNGAWRPLKFEVKPDPAFTQCPSPPVSPLPQSRPQLRDAAVATRAACRGHGARERRGIRRRRRACPALTGRRRAHAHALQPTRRLFLTGSLVATVLLMPGKTFLDLRNRPPARLRVPPGEAGFLRCRTDCPQPRRVAPWTLL